MRTPLDGTANPRQFPAQDNHEGYLDWKAWDQTRFGEYSAEDARYFTAELAQNLKARSRVLEIGFGNGALLSWLKKLGSETYGVETNPILVERATTLLGFDHAFADLDDDRLSALAGTFTCIVAFDVIEHVEQDALGQMFSRIRSLLAPEGVCILRFPNGDSPFGRYYQYGDPTHVTTVGSGKIVYFARRTGLKVEAVRAPAVPLRGVGLMRGVRRRLLRATRAMCDRIVGHLYFGGPRFTLDPNCVAVLKRPR